MFGITYSAPLAPKYTETKFYGNETQQNKKETKTHPKARQNFMHSQTEMEKWKMILAPVFQVITTKNGLDKSTEIIAAVGAGLVPATMAFLAPMVLGRKRRSNPTAEQYNSDLHFTYDPIIRSFM